jgi:hypothetical protein
MFCHSSIRRLRNYWRVCGGLLRYTLRPNSSHTCSIGLRYGEFAGQSILFMLLVLTKSFTILPQCGLALSSWKTAFGPICCKNGNTKGLKISSIYHCEFKLPLTMYSWVLRLTLIPAQTITDPPPKLSCSLMLTSAKCSPWRR